MTAYIWRICLLIGILASTQAAEIIREGQPLGAIWHAGDSELAAKDLVEVLEKMSGAKVPVTVATAEQRPAADTPAIVLGKLALAMGLHTPAKTLGADAYTMKTVGLHLLMAGESPNATRFAANHFLQARGCRWYFSSPVGEIIPKVATISLDGFQVSEQPDFIFREVWGMYRHHYRLGGADLPNRHDWEHVPSDKYFAEHPEYFAMRGGERKPGRWVCTTNPEVAKIFAAAYVEKAKKGQLADTISPPDGRGFCECEPCKAVDVPGYLEPSNNALAMSDRYAHFFNAVGKIVARDAPGFLLSFYCYSDYTLPPKTLKDSSDNLVAWVTTIRFCRLHGVNNPTCESRQRYRQVVEGWGKLMRTASYDYNYNLAEVTVPISKITYIKENIPFLKQQGAMGVNMEAMQAWNLYGPHTYLTARLLWDADADADAILDEFYSSYGGPAAAPLKAYWERIDRACVAAKVHLGSFYGLHAIWTPELLAACTADLDAAAALATAEPYKEHVALFRSGLESARQYLALREAMNTGDFVKAKELFTAWLDFMVVNHKRGYNTSGGYHKGYAERILGGYINLGLERVTGDRQKIVLLPDVWDYRADWDNKGEELGLHLPGKGDEGWTKVKTFSSTLNEQGFKEELTWLWYRTTITLPKDLPAGRLALWFGEVDGSPSKVWVDGVAVGEWGGHRRPNEVEVTGHFKPGATVQVVLRTGHLGISELHLGGILRPVMLYAGPAVPPPPPPPEKKK